MSTLINFINFQYNCTTLIGISKDGISAIKYFKDNYKYITSCYESTTSDLKQLIKKDNNDRVKNYTNRELEFIVIKLDECISEGQRNDTDVLWAWSLKKLCLNLMKL